MIFSIRLVLIPVALVVAVTLLWLWRADSDLDPEEAIHLGVWACESGPPGNRLHFWHEETALHTPMVHAIHGRVKIDGLWGMEAVEGTWNFGYWEPLIVNLVVGDECRYAAIKKINNDHLLLRYTTECEVLLHAAFDHPDVLRFRRVVDESE